MRREEEWRKNDELFKLQELRKQEEQRRADEHRKLEELAKQEEMKRRQIDWEIAQRVSKMASQLCKRILSRRFYSKAITKMDLLYNTKVDFTA